MIIYTKRKEGLTRPFLDTLSVEPGIKVNLVTGEGDAMIKWLKIDNQVVFPVREQAISAQIVIIKNIIPCYNYVKNSS